MLIEKYRPSRLSEWFGGNYIVQTLQTFLKNNQKKPLLLTGDPGNGKTSLVLALNGEGYNVMEVNASDSRRVEDIKRIIRRSLSYQNLEGKRNILFFDEADALTKKAGEVLLKKIKHLPIPVILACNYREKLLYGIRKVSIEMKVAYSKMSCERTLDYISECEGRKIPFSIRNKISTNTNSIRSAVQMLEEYFLYGETNFKTSDRGVEFSGKMKKLLTGQEVKFKETEIRMLLKWALVSGASSRIISVINIMMKYQRSNNHIGLVRDSLIGMLRSNKVIKPQYHFFGSRDKNQKGLNSNKPILNKTLSKGKPKKEKVSKKKKKKESNRQSFRDFL